MDEEIVTQLGLLLNQVRFTRLAVENIERSTTRYAGVALTAGGAGAALGAPPLENGALKVHVVNLGDLAGPNVGDVIFGVIGGAGRFLGGFFGGLVGGTISGVAFPYTVGQVATITDNIVKILAGLGSAPTDPKKPKDEGSGLLGILDRLDKVLEKVKEVLGFATKGDGDAASKTVKDWTALIESAKPLVGGLVLLGPILTATIASLLNRLPALQAGILDLLEFAVRNALRLRAVIFAVLIDTVSLASRLVGGVLAELAKAVDVILGSIFTVAKAALETVFKVIELLGPGLKTTVDNLLLFLNNDVVGTLNALGNTSVVKLIWHLSLSLPFILPALAKISGVKLSKDEEDQLDAARKLAPSASPSATPPTLKGFPKFEDLLPKAKQDEAVKALEKLGVTVTDEAAKAFGAAQGAVAGSAKVISGTLGTLDEGLKKELTTRLGTASTEAGKFSEALAGAKKATSGLPEVDKVAAAYEGWLVGGGLRQLVGNLNGLFREDAKGPGGSPLLDAAAAASTPAPPAVPVEIERIEIRLVKPTAAPADKAAPGAPATGKRSSIDARGGSYVDPDLLALGG
jgi:hypothetical protein